MKVTATKKVVQQGNSLCVNVTKECDLIGADRGDLVEVTIKKVDDEEDGSYTDDDVKRSMCDERYASH